MRVGEIAGNTTMIGVSFFLRSFFVSFVRVAHPLARILPLLTSR